MGSARLSRLHRAGAGPVLLLLLAACTPSLPGNGGVSLPEPAAGPEDPGPCPAALRAALADGPPQPETLALRIADPSLERGLERDLPLRSEVEARCVVTVGPVVIETARLHRLGRLRVRGEREIARRRRINPEYRMLAARLRAQGAEAPAQGEGGPQLHRTGEPELDLLALALETVTGGLATLLRDDSEADKLRRELERTPRWLEEPIVESYTYELLRYEGEKRGTIGLALVDRERGQGWRAEVPFHRKVRLALARGRDPRDRTEPAGVVLLPDRAALAAWPHLPPQMRLSRLLRALAAATEHPPAALTEELAAGPPMPAPAAGPGPLVRGRRTSASLVLLEGAAGPVAAGFYVTPELVLLPAEQLPDSALIPLTFAAHRRTYGILERLDEKRELALVWVPRRGPPLDLARPLERTDDRSADTAAAWLVPPFADLVLPGTPLALGGRIVGVALDPELDPEALVSAKRLRAFLGQALAGGGPLARGQSSRAGTGARPGV